VLFGAVGVGRSVASVQLALNVFVQLNTKGVGQSAMNTALTPTSIAVNNQRVVLSLRINAEATKDKERRGPACVTEQGPLLDGDDYWLWPKFPKPKLAVRGCAAAE